MTITVCIGSACHIKGSRQIVDRLQYLIRKNELGDKISLSGAFCMHNCKKGICVTVDGDLFSLAPEDVDDFFENNIKQRL